MPNAPRGNYTRFARALRAVNEQYGGGIWTWDYDTVNLLAGGRVVGTVQTRPHAELICSALNYMLDLERQIGPEPDARDDLLMRTAGALARLYATLNLTDQAALDVIEDISAHLAAMGYKPTPAELEP